MLRWKGDAPTIQVIHRIPNAPVHLGKSYRWPLNTILAGLEEGLRKAAHAAPEGVASIGVDSWSVDYVRLAPHGEALCEPFCYRDERTIATKEAVDAILPPRELFARTGALPMRLNTIYQLMADPAAGPEDRIDPYAPWVMMPEFVLQWLGGQRVGELPMRVIPGSSASKPVTGTATSSARSICLLRPLHPLFTLGPCWVA